MADAAVTFLLEKLELVLKYYVNLVSGAENELHNLENNLRLLKSFLLEAAQMQTKEPVFREMERQIREVVYEAEDTIDSSLTNTASGQAAAAAAKGKSFLKLRLKKSSKSLSLAQQVKSLSEDKVKPMIDLVKTRIGNGSGTSVQQSSTKVTKVQLIRQDNVVGFEDEEKTLVKHLMEERDELDVVSIIGMPGLGKTTLAWKIYQSKNIRHAFPIRIWVYVSQDFSIRDVLLSILKVYTNVQDLSSMDDPDLAQRVRDYLETGKFLLVMDDVWTVETWNAIQCVLPKKNGMGKVMITSRHENVGRHANVSRNPHKLRFLTSNESWQLLQLEVFGKLDECPQELVKKGDSIAKQCDGLPLAIVVIGGILVDQFSTKQLLTTILDAWEDVSTNVSTYVKNNKDHSILDIVALSYNKLPDYLKDCFVYLGVFPEDYEIPVWTLTLLWIAEGFIQRKEGQSLEETAEENLMDLITRNLVMVGKTNHTGQLKTCRVHDVIREFCISKAAPAEQNLFQEIKKSKQGDFYPPFSDRQMYRRLCIHFRLPDFLPELHSGKVKIGRGVRSFLCFSKESFVLHPKYISTIPDTFNLLRVLNSKSFKFTQFPLKITRLIHLRYITLSCDELDVLPEAVSELWNLQTLVVDTKSRRLEIKANIWKLFQLRHIKTKAAIFLVINEEAGDAGENLQTLSRMAPEYCTTEVFKRARNLKRLGIRGSLATVFDTNSLEKLDLLENLKLVNDLHHEAASERPLRGLPQPNSFPPKIRKLTISATHLEWKHMSTLGKIDTLQVLKLKDNAFKGQHWRVCGGFHSLQFLLITSSNLVFWEPSDDYQFPSLSCLVLKNCEELDKIPLSLAKSLHKLEIEHVTKSAVKSAKEIEEMKLMQGQQKARWGGFKLSIGPGCA